MQLSTDSRVHGLQQLRYMGSAVVVHGLSSCDTWAQWLWYMGSVVVVHWLSCSTSCEIFLDQGLNLCLLHWQKDSLPLSHQGSPSYILGLGQFFIFFECTVLNTCRSRLMSKNSQAFLFLVQLCPESK